MMHDKQNTPDEIKRLVDGIGAMSEITVIYWNGLIEGGVSTSVAVQLTCAFIGTVFAQNGAGGARDGGDGV